ncbi:MAG: apolipoprotein N-acyltransferase [Planctomycetota bacterium]
MDGKRLRVGFREGVFAPALLGSVATFLAFPPVGWSPLVFLGPMAWLLLVQRPTLSGQRPYLKVWLAGGVFWLLTLHWIRLPHPLNHLGLFLLAAYLGAYLPAFVWLARVGVHRLRVPLWFAAPAVWVGLDWVRGHLFSGFLMGSLAHALYDWPGLIQLSDLTGEYGISFAILFVAASAFLLFGKGEAYFPRKAWIVPFLPVAVYIPTSLSPAWVSVHWSPIESPTSRIALIQGTAPALFSVRAETLEDVLKQHLELTSQAVEASDEPLDLIVWPECMFPYTYSVLVPGYTPPEGLLDEERLKQTPEYLTEIAKGADAALLVGVNRFGVRAPHDREATASIAVGSDVYNSSIMVRPDGEIVGVYDKMHLVPFGEYIPLADWVPGLAGMMPIAGGTQPGKAPVAMELDGVTYSVNICYESAVPHFIRRQVKTLANEGQRPDVLVNLTNDAWFKGSSELDMHLACGVFRAVENRTPMVIAANGGLSAYISRTGHIVKVTRRQKPGFLIVDVPVPEERRDPTFYTRHGDWFAGLCLVCCTVFALVGALKKKGMGG